MDTQGNTVGPATPDPDLNRIVSVNDRGGAGSNIVAKVIFVIAALGVITVGGLITFKKLSGEADAKKAGAALAAKSENKPASVSGRRLFGTDTTTMPPVPGAEASGPLIAGAQGCPDGSPGIGAKSSDGKPILDAQGRPMRVCGDGRIIVPELDPAANAPPIPISNQGSAQSARSQTQTGASTAHVDRYGGDVMLSGGGRVMPAGFTVDAGDPMQNPLIRAALSQALSQGDQHQRNNSGASPPGSVGSLLQPSVTQTVRAAKLGDRNMILPMGRSIDCGLSVKIISELAGLTSCVLSQNVYSDNGRVVLLERGSEATGEYRSVSEQGQKRLFVIWTRIKTPNGVIINLDSPGADSLGTSGLPGRVDNHWWQRVGGAFLLSTVKDAIAYKTAEASNGSAGGAMLYQNTTQTGDRMAEKVLDSTINIRPTIYKNQGDRGSIYVARDLDFGSVYALRAQ